MSGSNGVYRWARTNREDELVPLRSRGITFHAFDYSSISTTTFVPGVLPPVSTNPNPTTLTPAQMFQNLTFDVGTINPISAPTFATTVGYLLNNGLLQLGYSWTVAYRNTAPHTLAGYASPSVGTVTINFPVDWSITGLVANNLTIAAGETVLVTYVVDSLGPPPTIRVQTGAPQASGGRNPYNFDKAVTIRPSNQDTTMLPLALIYDFELADGQHMFNITNFSATFAAAGPFANSMIYLRETSIPAIANLNNCFIFCSNGALAPTVAIFAVRLDGAAFAPSFNIVSAAEFKTDIVAIGSTLVDAYQMTPRQYRYTWDAPGTIRYGFVSDEITALPSLAPLVTNQSVDMYSICAVQQQTIRDLNARLIALQTQVDDLIAALIAPPNNLTL